ncbi:MAG: flagellar hook-basal body complex protein FliE [bacterium]|jgi:flagellar hook-basal body complex protein FliE
MRIESITGLTGPTAGSSIQRLTSPSSPGGIESITRLGAETNKVEGNQDFGQMLSNVLEQINGAQQKSAAMVTDFAKGKPVELHQVMLAMERANTALQLTVQVRNKIIEAYQEISRMQV